MNVDHLNKFLASQTKFLDLASTQVEPIHEAIAELNLSVSPALEMFADLHLSRMDWPNVAESMVSATSYFDEQAKQLRAAVDSFAEPHLDAVQQVEAHMREWSTIHASLNLDATVPSADFESYFETQSRQLKAAFDSFTHARLNPLQQIEAQMRDWSAAAASLMNLEQQSKTAHFAEFQRAAESIAKQAERESSPNAWSASLTTEREEHFPSDLTWPSDLVPKPTVSAPPEVPELTPPPTVRFEARCTICEGPMLICRLEAARGSDENDVLFVFPHCPRCTRAALDDPQMLSNHLLMAVRPALQLLDGSAEGDSRARGDLRLVARDPDEET